MEAPQVGFGREHFGGARLGDRRRTERLVYTAEQLMRHPEGTLPQRLRGWADLMGLYRLVRCERVTHAAVLAPHARRTRGLMAREPVVLLLHDWTELDYTTRTSLQGLGQIGRGTRRGYVCQNTLAVTPDRRVLGLAHQHLHARRRVPAGETARQRRDHPGRESRLWVLSAAAVGPAPGPGLWVDVADRGADVFEFMDYELAHGRHFLVRARHGGRVLEGDDHLGADRVYRELGPYVRDLPPMGTRPLRVAAGGGAAARVATVAVSAGPLTLAPQQFPRGECRGVPLELWAVRVAEVDAPSGVEPLEWVLLGDLPAGTAAAAWEKVDWYGCRPVVEELHKAMKTGASVERPQFESADRLEPVIALLSVVSAALLGLRELARRPDADRTPATSAVPRSHVRVLAAWRYGEPSADLTLLQFVTALGRLGGHLNRKGDGPPGWLTLWRGWNALQLMIEGAELAGPNRSV
jgi:hypothetical protein